MTSACKPPRQLCSASAASSARWLSRRYSRAALRYRARQSGHRSGAAATVGRKKPAARDRVRRRAASARSPRRVRPLTPAALPAAPALDGGKDEERDPLLTGRARNRGAAPAPLRPPLSSSIRDSSRRGRCPATWSSAVHLPDRRLTRLFCHRMLGIASPLKSLAPTAYQSIRDWGRPRAAPVTR